MEENTQAVENTRTDDNIKAVVEALLFSSEKPLMVDQIRKVLDNLAADQIRGKILELKEEYEHSNRGMRIYEVAGGYQMITAPVFATFLRKLYKGPQSSEKLSKPALETLAIIAYKQPLSKLEIESLRKVNVDGVMATLLDKNLIRVTGRKKAPGRPKVYGTSREFLEYFGLKSLEELPKIDNFPLPQELLESPIEETPKKEENNVPGEAAQTN
ncbi:MAG: SMC-Scp complex subunit ScpB [Candidatus Omnitrophica bacterium]|jgi:segregation and condensation protein B|nr:SMC-Scp complex subunit ScpB [Candidatus Omnitrophota bacterium]MDD5079162.1 SMC-Scp complex subunit ScpB [Candidatus Omnitrophota bacterium]